MDFRTFEQRGWERAANAYAQAFLAITGTTARPLLDGAQVGPRMRVVDVATGPGLVAAVALGRKASVVALDFAASMARLARASVADARVVQGDAEALPFAPATFDAAFANFGFVHFAHPERALRELARVVRPGARVAFSTWATPDQNPFFGLVYRALEAHAKKPDVPPGPPFFELGSPAKLEALLASAGLVAPRVQTVEWRTHVPDARTLLRWFAEATVRTAAIVNAQDPATLALIEGAVARDLEEHRGHVPFQVPVRALVASAAKP